MGAYKGISVIKVILACIFAAWTNSAIASQNVEFNKAEYNDNTLYISGKIIKQGYSSDKIAFGEIASPEAICSKLNHEIFQNNEAPIKDKPIFHMPSLIAKWIALNSQRISGILMADGYRVNGIPNDANNIQSGNLLIIHRDTLKIANKNLSMCMQNIFNSDPEKYKIIEKKLNLDISFPKMKPCFTNEYDYNEELNQDGEIKRVKIPVRKPLCIGGRWSSPCKECANPELRTKWGYSFAVNLSGEQRDLIVFALIYSGSEKILNTVFDRSIDLYTGRCRLVGGAENDPLGAVRPGRQVGQVPGYSGGSRAEGGESYDLPNKVVCSNSAR